MKYIIVVINEGNVPWVYTFSNYSHAKDWYDNVYGGMIYLYKNGTLIANQKGVNNR